MQFGIISKTLKISNQKLFVRDVGKQKALSTYSKYLKNEEDMKSKKRPRNEEVFYSYAFFFKLF